MEKQNIQQELIYMNSLFLFDNSNLSPFPANACGASVGELIHPHPSSPQVHAAQVGHLPPKGGKVNAAGVFCPM